jgi:hypothetical protein
MKKHTEYQPQWQSAKFRRRCQLVFAFLDRYVISQGSVAIASTQLYRHFGNTSQPQGRWLFERLLTVTNSYYNSATGCTRRYQANTAAVTALKQQLGIDTLAAIPVPPDLAAQLASGQIEYRDTSSRSFSSLQYIPRERRSHLLNQNGYSYQYDIQAAAPSLLMQLAQRQQPDLELAHLSGYVANRSAIRASIAQECQITADQVKLVINSVLQGAAVTCYYQSKLFQELNRSYAAIAALKTCQQFQLIKQDIRQMWRVLRDQLPPRTRITSSGQTRRVRASARDKSQLYRELENQVGQVIRRYLKRSGARVLWLHDGWICDQIADPGEIEQQVRRQTEYCIQLDWTRHED